MEQQKESKMVNSLKGIAIVLAVIGRLLLIIIVLYILFKMFFVGYSRNLASLFRFGHKEPLDESINTNNVISESFAILNEGFEKSQLVHIAKIFGIEENIKNVFKTYERFKVNADDYIQKKKDSNIDPKNVLLSKENIVKVMRDFYIAVDTIHNKLSREYPTNACAEKSCIVKVNYNPFYEKWLRYKRTTGEINSNKIDNTTLITNLYANDMLANERYNLEKISDNLESIGNDTEYFMTKLKKNPVLAFVIIPETSEIKKIQSSMTIDPKKDRMTLSHTLESIPAKFWVYNEIQNFDFSGNGKTYDEYVNELSRMKNNWSSATTRYFLNKTQKERSSMLEFEQPSLDPKMVEFLHKRPIFNHIYYNMIENVDYKRTLYKQVMDLYVNLCGGNVRSTDMLDKLYDNGKKMKSSIVHLLNCYMYLKKYKLEYHKLYMQIYCGPWDFAEFLKGFMDPYVEDLFRNRVVSYWKLVCSGRNLNLKFKDFLKWWDNIGVILKKTISKTFKAFFTSHKVEEPQAPTFKM
jgi:hypothetical protein